MRNTLDFLLIALCFNAAAQNSSLPTQPRLYITHVTVIDTETGKEATEQTVVISNSKISKVAKSDHVAVPANARMVDGRGKYLIPGLWDMHVHRTEYESTYPIYIANGVTGVREMSGPFDANKFRAALAAKKIDSPHIYFASPIIDGTPPRVPDQIVVNTAEEARKIVAEQKTAGANFIKVMDRLSRDAYFAIIEEAKRQAIPVVGHVPFAISAWEASASKQESIEHVHAVPLACSTREAELRAKLVASDKNSWKVWNPIYLEAYQSYSDPKCQQLFAEFKKNGTWSVPTLVVYRSTAMSGDPQFRNDDRLRYFDGQMRTWLSKNAVMERKDFEPSDVAVERELLDRRKWLVGKLFRAGVPMLAGTDTPNPFCFPGFALHDELALMVDSGVTPLGALQAATRNPAMFLNATDKYGSVAPGKVADLVLLDADPLKDIHNTTKISEVFLGGREFDRAALDQLLKNAQTAAAIPSSDAASGPRSSDTIKMSAAERSVWEKEEAYWRFVQAKDRDDYVGLWDDRFVGWPRLETKPIHKDRTFGSLEGRKLLDYKLEPLSVREYGENVVITLYRVTAHSTNQAGADERTIAARLTHTWMKTPQGWQIIGGMSGEDKPNVAAPPQRTSAEAAAIQQVLVADEARRLAMLHSDVSALDSLLADDVTIVWGDGTTDNKASALELFRSGRLHYQQSDYQNTKVRVFGDIAILTGDAMVRAVSDGESIGYLLRVTRVYALRQDRWQLVSVQTTRAAATGGASISGSPP